MYTSVYCVYTSVSQCVSATKSVQTRSALTNVYRYSYTVRVRPWWEALLVSPEAIGGRILTHLKRAAESSLHPLRRLLGFSFGALTVSVPVGFSKTQRAATIRAGNLAGQGTSPIVLHEQRTHFTYFTHFAHFTYFAHLAHFTYFAHFAHFTYFAHFAHFTYFAILFHCFPRFIVNTAQLVVHAECVRMGH